jgi:hypothetical protein
MRAQKITGPIFISIAEGDQLSIFVEKNPEIPKELLLSDDYTFSAYKAVGFKTIAEDKEMAKKGSANMKKPELSWSQWTNYFTSVSNLAPIPAKLKFGEIPQGVLRLGGTFAIDGKSLKYVYEDGVPGDHPNPTEVLRSFGSL